ncbi:MAG: hypothetical protein IIC90_13280 [Chloroflexi bacterium]|nr:hypothetical protein [Chloroflexota bacterium]
MDVVALSDDIAGVDAEVERQAGLVPEVAATLGGVDRLPGRRETAMTPSPSTLPSIGVPAASVIAARSLLSSARSFSR